MSQADSSMFQNALDTIEALSPEEQQTVIDLIQRRLTEQRRLEIARNAETTLQAVREGRANRGSVEELKTDLLAES